MAFVYDETTGRFTDDALIAGMPAPKAPPEESGLLRRTVGDAATSLTKGLLVGLPQAAVGLANIATFGMAEKPLGAIGDALTGMGERIDKKYSTQHAQQAEEVAQTKGFLPTIGAYLARPGYLVDTAVEQLPTMFGGAKAGQMLGKSGALGEGVAAGYAEGASSAALTNSAIKAAAVGEGAITAGQNVEQIRQDAGGETTFGQRAAAAAAGVVTGAISFGAGKLADKLGIATPEAYFAGAPGATTAGRLAADGTRMEFTHAPGTLSRIGRGVLSEGVFEELPQSMQEQMWNNVALDRPLMEGVPEAAGQGLVLGGAMGGTIAGRIHNNKLTDGVNAIQYLSQPPLVGENGAPIVDLEKANAAFAALTALHPPASPERGTMQEWRATQLDKIAKGEQIDWAAFGAITTNHGLMAMAAGHIADVRARQEAYAQQAEVGTAIANGQLPVNIVDDMGNEVPRQQVSAPTKQEIAKAARMEKALSAGDAETLAREQGVLVRQEPPAPTPAAPTTVTPASPAPAPATKAAPRPNDPKGWDDAKVAEEAAKLGNDTSSRANQIRREAAKRAEASMVHAPTDSMPALPDIKLGMAAVTHDVNGAPKGFSNKAVTDLSAAVAKGMPSGGTVAELEAFLRKFAEDNNAGRPVVAELAGAYADRLAAKQGAQNVQGTNVNPGAQPQPAPSQAPAAVPQDTPGPAAQGDAAGQPAEKAAQEVAPSEAPTPKESTNEAQPVRQESSTVPAEGSTSSKGKKRKSVRQESAPDEGGDAAPVRQEVAPKVRTKEDAARDKAALVAAAQVEAEAAAQASMEAETDQSLAKLKMQMEAHRSATNSLLTSDLSDKARAAVEAARAKAADTLTAIAREKTRRAVAVAETTAKLQESQPADLNRLKSPQAHWDAIREENAKAAGVPLDQWYVPAWADLPEKLFVPSGERKAGKGGGEALSESAKLNQEEYNKAKAEWAKTRSLEALKAIQRYALKDSIDRLASKMHEQALNKEDNQAETVKRLAEEHALARALIKLERTSVKAEGHKEAVVALLTAYNAHLKVTSNGSDKVTTLAEMRERMGAELSLILPTRTAEEYRQMAKTADTDVTPFQLDLAKRMAKFLNRTKGEMSQTRVTQLQGELDILKELGKEFGIAKKEWTDKDALDVFDAVSDLAGDTMPSIKLLMQAISGTNNVHALLDTISVLSTNPVYKPLAAMLRAMGADGIKFVYKDQLEKGTLADGSVGYKRGSYNQSTSTITIYAGGENPQTLMHEVVHALTVHQLGKAAQLVGKATNQGEAQALKGYRQLTELFEYLAAQPELAGQYAFKNVKEFVAEVHTNPKLQAKLKEMQAPQGLFGKTGTKLGSLLQSFLDAVMGLLGLKPGAVDALSKALELTTPYFAPNTAKASAAIKRAGVPGASDAMISPVAAMIAPFQRAGAYLNTMDTAASRGFWTDMKAAGAKALLAVTSSGTIEQYFRDHPALSFVSKGFKDFFKQNENGAQVRNALTDVAVNGHSRNVDIALRKTGRYDHYNNLMGLISGESSNIGFDPSQNYDVNAASRKGLDPKLKNHINYIHREFSKLANGTPEEREIARLLKNGEKVSRLMFIEQTAALVQSAIRHMQTSPTTRDAATEVLTRFNARIDLLQSEKGLTNGDPGRHYNALSYSLDKSLNELFAHVEATYPMSGIAAELKEMKELYSKGLYAPYMHLGRHGMYYVDFHTANNSAQTTAKLQAVLKPYGVVVGPFHGSRTKVYLRVENQAIADDIRKALLGQPGLIATHEGAPHMASGAISTAGGMESALGQSRVARELRSRMKAKMEDMGQQGKQTPELLAAFDAMKTAVNDSLMDMLEVNSARQANQKRDHVPGYSSNYIQNFSKRAQWAVSSIANVYTADGFAESFREMQQGIDQAAIKSTADATRGQQVHDELAKRFSNSYKAVEHPFIRAASVFGNNFYLALAPAYVIGNLMQPYMLTLPYLGGKFGFVKAAKGMARASADAFRIINEARAAGWKEGGFSGVLDLRLDPVKMGLTPDEAEFARHLLRTGIVDSTQAHELGRMADGDVSKLAHAAKVASVFNHYSEVANRLSTGLVAYRLAQGAPDKRAAFAKESILRTQFDYTEHNTARAIGRHGFLGAATPLFMQFQRFAFFTMEHYALMAIEATGGKTAAGKASARKGLAGTLAATALVTGTMGLPFTTALVAVLDALRGEDDDDKDLREEYREWLAGVFGKDMAELVAKGALSRGVLGIDMTGSLGQQDLIPGSRFAADRREWKDKMKDQSKTLLGPALNAGMDIYAGGQHVADGDVAEGIKAMLPRALKGPWSAGVVGGSDGEYRDKSGRTLPIAAAWGDYPKMIAGFTPAAKAEQSEENFMYQSQLYQLKQDKAKAQKKAIAAAEEGDFAESADILQTYALSHPDNPIKGVSSLLQARARGQAVGALTGVIEPNKRNLPLLQDYTGTYNYE